MAGRIVNADVLEALGQLPDGLFHCAVTSPPYWRLRAYQGVDPTLWADGQRACLGAEADPDSFVRHLVQVFGELRRVLRDDGVLFVNLGETYSNEPGKRKPTDKHGQKQSTNVGSTQIGSAYAPGLQPGDRCGIPERFALAMQADGWCWRDTIIWAKKSPMPMSRAGWRWMRCRVKLAKCDRSTDRYGLANDGIDSDLGARGGAKWQPCPGCEKCLPHGGYVLRKARFCTTAAHEPIFMFVKGGAYFCDSEAASEPAVYAASGRENRPRGTFNSKGDAPLNGRDPFRAVTETRLPRSVWHLSSEPSKEKHFAAFPTAIPKRLIEMATSKAGCCPACGACYAPVVESERVATRPGVDTKCYATGALDPASPYRDHTEIGNRDPQRHVAVTRVAGYRATCSCQPAESVPCRVLEPFLGSGTTCQVAEHLGRDWLGIEASAAYVEIAERRIKTPLRSKKANGKRVKPMPSQPTLF